MRIEWRNKAEGDDAVLAVEEGSNVVLEAWKADVPLLTDFLNDMNMTEVDVTISGNGHKSIETDQREPSEWGDLVLARSESGDILSIDPQLYWEGVSYWFRSRGADPHPWRGPN